MSASVIAFHIGVVNAGQAEHGGIVGERDGGAALLGDALDLRDRRVHVPGRQQAAWDEAARMGAAPFIDMPVIIGAQMDQGVVLVRRLVEQAAVETHEASEIQRRSDAVDVHIVDARAGIVDTLAQLIEGGGLHAVFFRRPADDGAQTDRGKLHPLVFPVVRSL
jgi:hypothetical protein